MKKVLFAMMLAAGTSAAFAQQPPIPEMQGGMSDFKNWLAYGDFGYNAQNNDNTSNATQLKSNNWSINPGLGYRVNEHLVIGVQGGINASHTKVTFTGITGYDENRTDAWTLGVFVRHNCCDLGKTFYCFSQLNVAYLGVDAYPNENFPFSSYNVTTQDQVVNGYGITASFVPSLGVRLPHAYSLQLNLGGIGYSYMTQDHGNGTTSNFNVTFAQQIRIGIAKEFNFHRSSEARAFREPDVELHSRIMENVNSDDEDGGGRREGGRKSHDMDDE